MKYYSMYILACICACHITGCKTSVDDDYATDYRASIPMPLQRNVPIVYMYCDEPDGYSKKTNPAEIKKVVLMPGDPRYDAVSSLIVRINPVKIYEKDAKSLIRERFHLDKEGFPESASPAISLIIQRTENVDVGIALVAGEYIIIKTIDGQILDYRASSNCDIYQTMKLLWIQD